MLDWGPIRRNGTLPNPTDLLSNNKQKENGRMNGGGNVLTRTKPFNSCESVFEFDATNTGNGEQMDAFGLRQRVILIGQIDAIEDKFVLLTDVNGAEFRVPREMIRNPELGAYYLSDGSFVKKGLFEPISINALANDSKALLDARAKLWTEKFGHGECTIQKIKEKGFDLLVKKIFVSPGNKEAEKENGIQKQKEIKAQNEIGQVDQTTAKGAPIESSASTEYESFPPSSSASNATQTQLPTAVSVTIIAVALCADGRGNVYMFSPEFVSAPLFRLSTQCVNVSLKFGKWYSLTNPSNPTRDGQTETGNKNGVSLIEICEVGNESELGPTRTRVANDIVQLYVEVKESDRSKDDATIYCLEKFPLVLDSAGFLNRFFAVKEGGPKIRHAPEPKIGIWCTLRKHSFNGIHWKIVRIDPESKPKKSVVANGKNDKATTKSDNKSTESKSNLKEENSPPPVAPTGVVRNVLKDEEVDESESFEGIVCSQNDTHFLVYCPGREWMAFLDKKQSEQDGSSLLGMWIQFQLKSEAGGRRLVRKPFTFAKQKIHATPAEDYVLIRTHLQIPREMDSGETPWCKELRANINDKADILKHKHHGTTVLATIGCPSKVASPDKFQWQLLNVED